ncbi:MAG: DUF262 domain-containing protein [Zoogloeaceae bacterium]|jgi:hypothetical protein|nr:DUF262 domain-containing protein [Zoogloeaceae bacterium]
MGSTFKSNDMEISEILKKIDDGRIKLPEFQRDWVWEDERIRMLIASISNSYPVGALMFLEYGGDTVRFKYRPFTGATADGKPEILVLDGQQRLTSIYGAMFCENALPTKDNKNKEIKRFYYLDIEKSLSEATDRIDAVLSLPEDRIIRENFGRDVSLDLSEREKEFEKHMFPLNIVYDPISFLAWLDEYRAHHKHDEELLQRLRQFTAEILTPILSYKVPVVTLGKDTPKEAVCQVFEHVNTGGKPLNVFDLLVATFAAEDFDLRKDWGVRHDKFKMTDLLLKVEATDFLTAITLLSRYYTHKSGGEAVSCKRKDLLAVSLSDYQEYADRLTNSFTEAANFLMEQRIFTVKDLPYPTQLIPLAVLFAILGSKAKDNTVRNKLLRWFWCGVFGEMYGGANETRYVNDVTGVTAWVDGGVDEPDTVSRAWFSPTRLLSLRDKKSAAFKGVLALILKSGAKDFISGSEMDSANFTGQEVQIHHIFPTDHCNKRGYDRKKWDYIVNKTPLFSRSNLIVGGSAPSHYLKKIEAKGRVTSSDLDGFIASHLIDVVDLRADNFEAYFVKRAKALLGLISDAMGKKIEGLGSDEVVAEFGASLE